eukprot:6196657-Pleurochrysis_carterae.AAC.1
MGLADAAAALDDAGLQNNVGPFDPPSGSKPLATAFAAKMDSFWKDNISTSKDYFDVQVSTTSAEGTKKAASKGGQELSTDKPADKTKVKAPAPKRKKNVVIDDDSSSDEDDVGMAEMVRKTKEKLELAALAPKPTSSSPTTSKAEKTKTVATYQPSLGNAVMARWMDGAENKKAKIPRNGGRGLSGTFFPGVVTAVDIKAKHGTVVCDADSWEETAVLFANMKPL